MQQPDDDQTIADDVLTLQSFGYAQELARCMRLRARRTFPALPQFRLSNRLEEGHA